MFTFFASCYSLSERFALPTVAISTNGSRGLVRLQCRVVWFQLPSII